MVRCMLEPGVFGALGVDAVFVALSVSAFVFAVGDVVGHFGFDADHGDGGHGADGLDVFGLFVACPSVFHPDFCFGWGCGALDGPSGVFGLDDLFDAGGVFAEDSSCHLDGGAFAAVADPDGFEAWAVESFGEDEHVDEYVDFSLVEGGELSFASFEFGVVVGGDEFGADSVGLEDVEAFFGLIAFLPEHDGFAPLLGVAEVVFGDVLDGPFGDGVLVVLGEVALADECVDSGVFDDFVEAEFDAVCPEGGGGHSEDPFGSDGVV